MSALANAIAPKTKITGQWIGGDGRTYRTYQLWLTEGWSASYMQVLTPAGWMPSPY